MLRWVKIGRRLPPNLGHYCTPVHTNVTVHLGGTFASVRLYDPTLGTSPIQTHRKINALTLTLSDHPVVIEVQPSK